MTRWWLVGLAACDGGGVTLDGGGPSSEAPDCDGAQTFVVGISAVSPSGRTVAITSATPAPPDVGDNVWLVEVTDASGAPVPGLAPAVTPWMPLHGHGLVPPTYAGAESSAGTYAIDTFDLIMPGLWQFTIELAPGAEDPDPVVFQFCAEG